MIAILSIFNNSEAYLERYFRQIKSLKEKPYLILLEGDSTDNTYELLNSYLKDYQHILLKRDKGKIYGSVVSEKRFKQLADLWNELFSLVPDNIEYVCFVESDLIWGAVDLEFLLELCEDYKFVCPLVVQQNRFYDIWAYRYTKTEHFDGDLYQLPTQITEIYSAGSFLVMTSEIAKRNKVSSKNAIVGFCEGENLFCVPVYVQHP